MAGIDIGSGWVQVLSLFDHPLQSVVGVLDIAGQLGTLLHKRMDHINWSCGLTVD